MMRTFWAHLHGTEVWSNYRPRIPVVLCFLALLGIAVMILSFWLRQGDRQTPLPDIMLGLGILLALPVIPVGLFVLWMRNYRSGLQRQMLDSIPWRGDEIVLDVGCGSGMLLNGASLRLTSGQAVGIDIWDPSGGGGNVDMLWRNARAEGVAEKIKFGEADARQMPFGRERFDVVLSSGAVHHISHTHADYDRLMYEMLRVLKPGGWIVLWDVTHVMNASAGRMEQAGFKCEISEMGRFLGFEMSLVFGIKPG